VSGGRLCQRGRRRPGPPAVATVAVDRSGGGRWNACGRRAAGGTDVGAAIVAVGGECPDAGESANGHGGGADDGDPAGHGAMAEHAGGPYRLWERERLAVGDRPQASLEARREISIGGRNGGGRQSRQTAADLGAPGLHVVTSRPLAPSVASTRRSAATARCRVTAMTALEHPIAVAACSCESPARYRNEIAC